jgi:hypothetical protein
MTSSNAGHKYTARCSYTIKTAMDWFPNAAHSETKNIIKHENNFISKSFPKDDVKKYYGKMFYLFVFL